VELNEKEQDIVRSEKAGLPLCSMDCSIARQSNELPPDNSQHFTGIRGLFCEPFCDTE